MRNSIFLLALLSFAAYGNPEKKWYSIEVLLFAHLTSSPDQSEAWVYSNNLHRFPTSVNSRDLRVLVESALPIGQEPPAPVTEGAEIGQVTPLLYRNAQSDNGFNSAFTALESNHQYQPVFHYSWIQSIGPKEESLWYHVYGGNDFSTAFHADGTALVTTADNELVLTDENTQTATYSVDLSYSETSASQPLHQFDGEIRFYLSSYLHIDMDMDVKNPMLSLTPLKQSPETIQTLPINDSLQTMRSAIDEPLQSKEHGVANEVLRAINFSGHARVKLNDPTYIDHPLGGLLVLIKPFDMPEKEVSTDMTTLEPLATEAGKNPQ